MTASRVAAVSSGIPSALVTWTVLAWEWLAVPVLPALQELDWNVGTAGVGHLQMHVPLAVIRLLHLAHHPNERAGAPSVVSSDAQAGEGDDERVRRRRHTPAGVSVRRFRAGAPLPASRRWQAAGTSNQTGCPSAVAIAPNRSRRVCGRHHVQQQLVPGLPFLVIPPRASPASCGSISPRLPGPYPAARHGAPRPPRLKPCRRCEPRRRDIGQPTSGGSLQLVQDW
jgi:hypothetical protein